MITLEEIKKNTEIKHLIQGAQEAAKCSRLYRTFI